MSVAVRAPAKVTLKRAALKGQPFTLPHFVSWSRDLVLDNGEHGRLEPFQCEFVADLFAGRPENWLILPEGNGKTTLVAGIVLYHAEFKPGAYVPVAAAARDQAEILYRQAEGFVLRTPRLNRIFRCFDGYRRIRHKKNRSRIQIFAADSRTGDGVIPTLAIVEEVHRHKDLSLYRTWTGKIRKRTGAQVVGISTAGEPYSDFEETRERIRLLPGATHKGTFTRAASEQIVIHDWAVPPKADITDMRMVKSANPFSGVTVETLAADFKSPTMTLPHWSRFKCNIPTRAIRSAITDVEWARAKTGVRIPKGVPIWLGLDVGWKHDTTAMVPFWARDAAFHVLGPATILIPPRDGSSLDPGEIHRALLAIHARNPIERIVMDITRAEETASWAAAELDVEVLEWSQSDGQATIDYEKFMTGLRTGVLHHTGDRGLTRHVMNAVSRMLPKGNTRFERPKSTRMGSDPDANVIDALVAAAMVNSKATTVAPAQRWGLAG